MKDHVLKTDVVDVVDELGEVKAQMAALSERERQLKNALIATGEHNIAGRRYDATVSIGERKTLDMEAVRNKLSPQFIRAHTRTTEVKTVRVVARKQVA